MTKTPLLLALVGTLSSLSLAACGSDPAAADTATSADTMATETGEEVAATETGEEVATETSEEVATETSEEVTTTETSEDVTTAETSEEVATTETSEEVTTAETAETTEPSEVTDVVTTACDPDPALIAAARACREDDDCPCGAHCELGRCVATCGADLPDCAGGTECDRFGRCRAPGDEALRPAGVPTNEGILRIDDVVAIGAAAGGAVRLEAPTANVGPVRVAVSAPFAVRCVDGAAFAAECTIPSVAAGHDVQVAVQRGPGVGGAPAPATGDLQIWWGSRYEARTIRVLGETNVLGAAALPLTQLQGSYRGSARRLSSGLATSVDSLTDPLAVLSVPLTAQVWANSDSSGVLDLQDRLHALSDDATDDRWPMALTWSAVQRSGQLTVVRRAFVGGAVTHDTRAEVRFEPVAQSLRADPTGQALSFVLEVAYTGLTATGLPAPRARWLVTLERTADLPQGASAPALDAAVAVTLPGTAFSTPTEWETALKGSMKAWSVETNVTELEQLVLTALDRAGTVRRLDACGSDAALTDASRFTFMKGRIEAAVQSEINTFIRAKVANTTAVNASGVVMDTLDVGPNLLPCGFDLDISLFPSCSSPSSDGESIHIDLCGQLATAYGCQKVAAPAPTPADENHVGLGGAITMTQGATNCTQSGGKAADVFGTITDVCVVPPVTQCGELVFCTGTDSKTSSTFGSAVASVLAVSGDLKCATGTKSAATAADAIQEATPKARAEVVDECVANLARLHSATPGAAKKLADLVAADAHCLDAVRQLLALGFATEPARQHLTDGSRPLDARADRLAQRLFQQWLEVHALIALESRERVLPLAITGSASGGLNVTAKEALGVALAGWDLLLHPRFGRALLGADPAALTNPDYRTRFVATLATDAGDVQAEGVVVAMLDALRADLLLADRLLDEKPDAADDLHAIGAALRYATVIEPMVTGLHARAQAALSQGSSLPWQSAYESARVAYANVLQRVVDKVTRLAGGVDDDLPSDADLPLYFHPTSTAPSSRFSAISDYLLGATPNSPGWAVSLVADAQVAFDDATTAYATELDQTYKATIDLEARELAIRRLYGPIVASFCGVPDGLTGDEILDRWDVVRGRPFDPNACFVKAEDPTCRANFEVANGLINRDDVLVALCTLQTIDAFAPDMVKFVDPNLTEIAYGDISTCGQLAPCSGAPTHICITCGGTTAEVSGPTLSALQNVDQVSEKVVADAAEQCRTAHPGAHARIPMPYDAEHNPLSDGRCFRGSGGELAMAVTAAAIDVSTARSTRAEFQERYDIATKTCIAKVETADKIEAANIAYGTITALLEVGKVAAGTVANYAQNAADCLYAVSGVDGIAAVGSLGVNLVVAGAGCAAGSAAAIASSIADGLQSALDEADRVQATIIQKFENDGAIKECYNDASMNLVGIRTSDLQITRAIHDLDTASLALRSYGAEAERAYREGRAELEELARIGSRVPRITQWLDAKILTFQTAMRRARRAAYLAVRAVEYEYQASLGARGTVARAETPAELDAVLDELKSTSATRTIGGSAPSQLKVIVSLADHVLQLEDRSDAASGEQELSKVDRLRLLLTSPANAAYDKDGKYIGQRIRFSLAPLGALGIGDAAGISIFATNDCAERMWSVSASVLGQAPLYRGSDTTFVRIDLLKQNTFYSQWCGDAPADAGPFQSASVRPSVNLFRDPLAGGDLDTGTGVTRGTELFARARIEAYLGVSRAELEQDDYANGDTSELAARGLYGEYALFIPKEMIARRQNDGTYSEGLDLDHVNDILLRIDYLSVAAP